MAGHPPKGSLSVQTQPKRQDGRGFFHVNIPHFSFSRYGMNWLDLKTGVPKGVGSNNFILSQFTISYHIISSCIDWSPWWPHKQSYCVTRCFYFSVHPSANLHSNRVLKRSTLVDVTREVEDGANRQEPRIRSRPWESDFLPPQDIFTIRVLLLL